MSANLQSAMRRVRRSAALDGKSLDQAGSASLRRQEILAIAARLFAERGFDATGIRDIAEAAGILSGSLYHHFATKEEMLQEILRRFTIELLENYERLARSGRDSGESLRSLVRFAMTMLIENRDVHAIVYNGRKFLARHEQFKYVEEAAVDMYRIWYAVLQDGVRTKTFRSDLNVHVTLQMILDMISSTVNWYSPQGRHTVDEIVDAQIALVLRGISA